MENEIEISENRLKTDEKGRFVKGTAPGPGRPKGSISIKSEITNYLAKHPEEVKEIVQHFVKDNRELMWQMLEGRPKGDVNMEIGMPQTLIDLLYGNKESGNTTEPTTEDTEQP